MNKSAKKILTPPTPALVFAGQNVLPRGDGSFVVQPGKPKAMLTPEEFSKFLGVTAISIRRYIYDGTIPPEFVEARGKARWSIDAAAVEVVRSALNQRKFDA